jgi:hypothetical protein
VFYLCTPAGFIWLVVVVEDTMAHRQAIRGEGGGLCWCVLTRQYVEVRIVL